MKARCIAYNDDGTICGKPASVLDEQRGGMVCDEHAPRSSRHTRTDRLNDERLDRLAEMVRRS